VSFNNPANAFAGSFTGNGAALTNVDAVTLGGLGAANFWQLGGNAGTTAGVNFLGTTDNQPLELKANGQRALRLESALETPNVIGGAEANSVSNTIRGATIAGGGLPLYPNQITADFATIGGGTFHIAGGAWATIAGGRDNRAYGESSTVAGGYANFVNTNAFVATIGGGRLNQVGLGVVAGTVGGGESNQAIANHGTVGGGLNNTNAGPGATIGGGNANTVLANDAVIGGGIGNRILNSSFQSTIGGGGNNSISSDVWYSTIAGGRDNQVMDDASLVTIAGGQANVIGRESWRSSIGAGYQNTIADESQGARIGGGFSNLINTNSDYATIGGGSGNSAGGDWTTISGGTANTNLAAAATISGGTKNTVTALGLYSSIGGGSDNSMKVNYGTIGGGSGHTMENMGAAGTIGGGWHNYVSGYISTVGGGQFNQALGSSSAIGGGAANQATGDYSTVPGGAANTAAGQSSFAAGRRAKANQAGTFVWADSVDADFASTRSNQFLIRASGGVGINTNNPTAALHIGGTPGVDGIRFPDGTLQTSAASAPSPAPSFYFSSGAGNNPATTNNFLAIPVTVTISSISQKVLVTSNKAFGSTAIGGATNLNLYIGYRPAGSIVLPSVVGSGVFGNRVAVNTRVTMGLSGVVTGLTPGNYDVGLIGNASDAANWNYNEFSYTTAVLY